MSGTAPPLATLSPDNQGPAVVVITYTLIAASILFTIVRLITNSSFGRGFGADDAAVVVGTAVGLAQSVLTERSADAGLGRQMSELGEASVDSYSKFLYISQILAVLVMACCKISITLLIKRLSVHPLCWVMMAGIAIWAVFSIFALAFQCQFPRPWVYTPDRCAGRGAVWYPVIVLNLLTDFALSFLIVPVVRNLQMRLVPRLQLVLLFGLRFLVCLAAIAQLVVLGSSMHSSNQSRAAVKFVMVNQIIVNLSIMTANIPSLSRFFWELHSRQNMGIPESRHELSVTGASSGNSGQAPRCGSEGSAKWRLRQSRGIPKFWPDDGSQPHHPMFADNSNPAKERTRPKRRKKDGLEEDEVEIRPEIAESDVSQTMESGQEMEDVSSNLSRQQPVTVPEGDHKN